ncbi:MAG: carboxymuconolactone decarboxylase family protein [Burkholderiales bacterium]
MAGKKKEPSVYLKLKNRHHGLFKAVEKLGITVRKAGPLNVKTAHLIQIAAAAALRSEGAVHSHVRRALEIGVKPEEIHHAIILVTSTISFPNGIAALSWAEDLLGKKK